MHFYGTVQQYKIEYCIERRTVLIYLLLLLRLHIFISFLSRKRKKNINLTEISNGVVFFFNYYYSDKIFIFLARAKRVEIYI